MGVIQAIGCPSLATRADTAISHSMIFLNQQRTIGLRKPLVNVPTGHTTPVRDVAFLTSGVKVTGMKNDIAYTWQATDETPVEALTNEACATAASRGVVPKQTTAATHLHAMDVHHEQRRKNDFPLCSGENEQQKPGWTRQTLAYLRAEKGFATRRKHQNTNTTRGAQATHRIKQLKRG